MLKTQAESGKLCRGGEFAAVSPCAQQVGLQRAASAADARHQRGPAAPAAGLGKATNCPGFIKKKKGNPSR